ncbi:S1 family peptidase [Planomicrobium okeanokoites]|uniref:S1 family peptidase n=1 Tax=Planomicrobium okeanokoites TaxID=244 RepID=UPI000A062ED0|nr:S1 family peptidase [Planomicrobium okeanokoites]
MKLINKTILLLLFTLLSFNFVNIYVSADFNMVNSNSNKSIDEQVKFRQEYGLDFSSEKIFEVNNQVEEQKYGIPLTEKEIEYLDEIEDFSDKHVESVLKQLRGNEAYSRSGTFYRDNKNGGQFVIGIAKGSANKQDIIDRIKDKVPAHAQEKIKFLDVNYSEEDLNNTIDMIFNDKESLEEQGVYVTQASDNVKDNKVTVGIYPYTEEAALILQNRYGKNLVVVVEKATAETESRTTNWDKMYGGIQWAGTAASSTGPDDYCSVGYTISNSRGYFVVTAGHCTYSRASFYQGGYYKGARYSVSEGGSADVGVYKMPSNRTTNGIYRYSYNDRTLLSQESVTSDYVGQSVAKVGATTNATSGVLESRNWRGDLVSNNGTRVTHYTYLRQASYHSLGGDSGGTVYWGSVLKGIHTASNGLYSHIYYVNMKTP